MNSVRSLFWVEEYLKDGEVSLTANLKYGFPLHSAQPTVQLHCFDNPKRPKEFCSNALANQEWDLNAPELQLLSKLD